MKRNIQRSALPLLVLSLCLMLVLFIAAPIAMGDATPSEGSDYIPGEMVYGETRTIQFPRTGKDDDGNDLNFEYTLTGASTANIVSVEAAGNGRFTIKALNVGETTITFRIRDQHFDESDTEATISGTIAVKPLDVLVKPDSKQKSYGAVNPELTYSIEYETANKWITKDGVLNELDLDLSRAEGENVGSYYYLYDTTSQNCIVSIDEDATFSINPLVVKVKPDSQQKPYGAKEPALTYSIEYDTANKWITKEDLLKELNLKLTRANGENVGIYSYMYDTTSQNFTVEFDEEAVFSITNDRQAGLSAITSRKSKLSASVGLKEGETVLIAPVRMSLAFDFGNTEYGTGTTIDKYIDVGALTNGVADKNTLQFDATGDIALTIKEQTLSEAIEGEALSWIGYLPAGTKITLKAFDRAETPVQLGNTVEITVDPQPIELELDFVTNLKYKNDVYHLGPNDQSEFLVKGLPGEIVCVDIYIADEDIHKTDYVKLNASGEFAITPDVHEDKGVPYEQIVLVTYIDVDNLEPGETIGEFVYDTTALPVSKVTFNNRDLAAKIDLQEAGTIREVVIGGSKFAGGTNTATSHDIGISWNGAPPTLIAPNSAITVQYLDAVKNTETYQGTVGMSTVSTPITLKIEPQVNASGYLGARRPQLSIYGTAQEYETLMIKIGSDFFTLCDTDGSGEWANGEKGNYAATVDIDRLPVGQSFTIEVSYQNVKGESASMSVIYDDECFPVTLTLPVYDEMTYLTGISEPNSVVYVTVNGEVFKADVDAYGYFTLQIPGALVEGDELEVTIYDIAGNESYRSFIIPELDDSRMIDVKAYPVGATFLYKEGGEGRWAMATPVDLNSLNGGSLSLPILAGAMYDIGTLNIRPSNGTVEVSYNFDKIGAEDYKLQGAVLSILSDMPGADTLSSLQANAEFGSSNEAPADKVWIVAEFELSINSDILTKEMAYGLGEDVNYKSYQSQK